MAVKLDDLEMAMEFVTGGEDFGSEAYLNLKTGKIYYLSDDDYDMDPNQINDDYIAIPSKQDLDLSRSTALEFVSEKLPSEYELIYEYFNKKGAFAKFKNRLEQLGATEQWYEYQSQATKKALKDWCDEYSIEYEK